MCVLLVFVMLYHLEIKPQNGRLAVLNTTCSADPTQGFCKDSSEFKFAIPQCGEEKFFRQVPQYCRNILTCDKYPYIASLCLGAAIRNSGSSSTSAATDIPNATMAQTRIPSSAGPARTPRDSPTEIPSEQKASLIGQLIGRADTLGHILVVVQLIHRQTSTEIS